MLVIQDKIVSDDVVEEQFLCDLKACKGACCWEGDFGAPLEAAELKTLERVYEDVKPFLSQEGKDVIEEKGLYVYYDEYKEHGTTLLKNGACTFMIYDQLGIAKCGIEAAHRSGAIDWKKPISCHLYPIRVAKNEHTGWEALNYDRWDICKAACELGKKEQLPVYKFLKEPLIRKYGEAFYEELDAAAEHLKKRK